jgi:response regulator RpfG family c-di-GMP phosphodiesterase
MMSAIKSRDDVIRGIEAGADDYLFKPLDHDVMLARIKMLVERKKNSEQSIRLAKDAALLTDAGVDLLDSAVPDADAHIEKLVSLQVRKTTDMLEKPRTVIIGLEEASAWQWHHFEFAFKDLSRVKLDFNPIAGISLRKKANRKC